VLQDFYHLVLLRIQLQIRLYHPPLYFDAVK